MKGWPALESLDWGRIYKRLVLYAARCLGRKAVLQTAEDLAQSAIRTALEKLQRQADAAPTDEDGMCRWLGAFVANLARNRSRLAVERRTEPLPDHWEGAVADDAHAIVEGLEHHRRLVAVAHAHGDTVAVEVLECIAAGVIARTEQADRLRRAVSQVDQARHRIRQIYLTELNDA